MAALSVLRSALRGASSSLFSSSSASSSSAASATSPLRWLLGRVPAGHVRYSSSDKRLFYIEPTKYFDNRFLNLTVFYLALTGVPAAIIITYINVFVGEAKLAEIPEGYIPENYEYHKHPITRWIVKHVLDPPEKNYEKDMHLIGKEMEKSHHYAIEAKARRLMRDRGDGPWSIMPVQDPTVIIRHHKATPDD
ncbi:NADH dehydrogenase [ubiquinone] 1 beta subcomplex subunit 5, mitochondrial-like [Lampetra fluviatilis]